AATLVPMRRPKVRRENVSMIVPPSAEYTPIRSWRSSVDRSRRMEMKKLLIALSLVLVTAPLFAQQPSLYKRLGGYDALAAVTDDLICRSAADQSLSCLFVGHSTDSPGRSRSLVLDQRCSGA